MLNLVVIFNCHGAQYITQLEQSAKFKATYKCTYIPIYNYLQGGVLGNNLNFIQEDLDKIMSANVLLIQYIKTDRGFLNHSNIIKMARSNCTIIKIPHYTFSGYHIDYDFEAYKPLFCDISTNIKKIEDLIKNITFDSDIVHAHLTNELENIMNLDKLSDISMYDIVKDNYAKCKLFYCRQYPTYNFFFFAAKQILKLLQIDDKLDNPVFTRYADHLDIPIFPNVRDILKLKFDNSKNIVEYILTCIKLNKKQLVLQNRKTGRIDLQKYNEMKTILKLSKIN